MTRYEAWLLIPFFPLYYYLKTRNLVAAVLILMVLYLFPVIWSICNYFHAGNLFLGFTAAKDETWATEVSLLGAVKILGRQSVQQLEWTLIILVCWGFVLQAVEFAKKKLGVDQVLYIIITLFYWVVMLKFATVRGETLQVRYLLLGLVMVLPLAASPLLSYFMNDRKLLSVVFLFVLITFLIPKVFVWYPLHVVTKTKPDDVRKIASWLKKGPYRHNPVLMTKIRGQSTYLPIYFPDVGPHDRGHFIYYPRGGMSDARLKKYLESRKPSLLISCKSDHKLISHIEGVLGSKLNLEKPIHAEGGIIKTPRCGLLWDINPKKTS